MKKLSFILVFCVLIAAFSFSFFIKRPTVSVVLPTYNRAKILPHAINSILNQTFKDFELIIVDDGSKDNSVKVIRDFMKKDSRIKLIQNKKNCGIACSRNIGNNAARGKYIAIMDSDDQALPWRLEVSVNYLENNPSVDVVTSQFLYLDSQISGSSVINYKTPVIDNKFSPITLMFHNIIPNVTSMFKRDFIKKHKIIYNEKLISAEDYDFWKQFFLKKAKIHKLNNIFTLVRYHETNNSEYYEKMHKHSIDIHHDLFSLFFKPAPEELKFSYSVFEKCDILKKVVSANKTKNVFDHAELKSFYAITCPTDNKPYFYLVHDQWENFLVQKSENLYNRLDTNVDASIKEAGDYLTVVWKGWPIEVFKKADNGHYHFLTKKYITIHHKNWQDEFFFVNDKRLCRASHPDCGTILKQTNDKFVFKWDNRSYKIDTFSFDKELNVWKLVH